MKWRKVKLTEISNPKQWKNLPISELTKEGFPVYGANGIIGRYKEFNHELPTLALTCRGATCGTINITQPKAYITSNAMSLDNLSDDVDQMFLYYALNKRGFKDVITGAAQPQITREGLSKIVLNIPERKEDQIHIAKLLCIAEELISQRKESIRMLEEYLRSTFLEMFGDPLKNEKGWELLKVSDYGESRLGKMLDGSKIIGNNLKPYLGNSNVNWFEFKLDDLLEMDFDEKDKIEFSLMHGDILMCEGGEIGRCAIWKNQLQECYFQKAIHRIRLNKKFALPEYFVYMFRIYTFNGGLNKYKSAATISHLTGEKLKKMKLPMPTITLQTRFVQIVEKTEAIKIQYEKSLQELENLYGSLSQRAFKGELE